MEPRVAHDFSRIPIHGAPSRMKGPGGSAKKTSIACDVATSSPEPPIVELYFDNKAVDLRAAQKSQVDDFVDGWNALGGVTDVRVDGYASMPGEEELNWWLSCERALNTAAALINPKGGTIPGVPQAQLSFFAHGRTDEFSTTDEALNRVATITAELVPAEAETPQALLIQNESGPTPNDCGGYDWETSWLLARNSDAGGHIIQHIRVDYDIRNSLGWDVTTSHIKKKNWDFWEAWPINAGEGAAGMVMPLPAPTPATKGGKPAPAFPVPYTAGSDHFADPDSGWGTKGTIVTTGDAQFYEGLVTLPSDFITKNPDTQANTAPSTTTDPKLTGGTPNVDHDLSVAWDCSLTKSPTKIVSHKP